MRDVINQISLTTYPVCGFTTWDVFLVKTALECRQNCFISTSARLHLLNEAYATSCSAYPIDFSCLISRCQFPLVKEKNNEIDSHQYSEQLYTAFTIGHKFALCMKKIQNFKHQTFRRLAESPFAGQQVWKKAKVISVRQDRRTYFYLLE